MTGPGGTETGEEDLTALHGQPPPVEGPGKEEIVTQIFSRRNTPVATHSRFSALACDDPAEGDSRSTASPSERIRSSALETDLASLPDFLKWLELNHAELQEWGHDTLDYAEKLRRLTTKEGLHQPNP